MLAGSLSSGPPPTDVYAIDDPVQLFTASVNTGLANTQAMTDNFRASIAALMGNEVDMQNSQNDAQRAEAAGSWYLEGQENFEEFLDEPTFGGFINQAISATGQFVPSAVALTQPANAIAAAFLSDAALYAFKTRSHCIPFLSAAQIWPSIAMSKAFASLLSCPETTAQVRVPLSRGRGTEYGLVVLLSKSIT